MAIHKLLYIKHCNNVIKSALTLAGSCAGVWDEPSAAGQTERWAQLTRLTPHLTHRGTAQGLAAHKFTALICTLPVVHLDKAWACPVVYDELSGKKIYCT